MTGTIHNAVHSNLGIYAVHFDAYGEVVLIGDNQMVHAPVERAEPRARLEMDRAYKRHGEELALLCAQLAARDAALDAVLELAKRWNDEHAETKDLNGGAELTTLLLKHGVHPK